MIYDRIKQLRESRSLTQAELAKELGITRAAVNAWEMGLSAPSTTYLVELARRFRVSTDYLLGLEHNSTLDISGLSDESVAVLCRLAELLRGQAKPE